MKLLCLDTFSGISGDMVLGMLVDLGIAPDAIAEQLRRLPIFGYTLSYGRENRCGICGTRATVEIEEQHHHRTWSHIDAMLASSSLDKPVADLSRRIFRRLGEAEARVHGTSLETVHFHEVGAVDSIVDIVGAAAGLTLLAPDRVICTPLPLSRGRARCAHGEIPLPAPAVLELLKGLPVVDGECDKELVTPTGAAIAAEIADFVPMPPMRLERTGYGAGSRDLPDRPNLLRALFGEADPPQDERDRVAVLQSHIDDAPPEWTGALIDRLMASGALDVALSPLTMKKNRPGTAVTVIAPADRGEEFARLLMRESSASGVRISEQSRLKLARSAHTVETSLGAARVKLLSEGARPLRVTPEYESCRELAEKSGLPLPEVYRLVERAADALLDNK